MAGMPTRDNLRSWAGVDKIRCGMRPSYRFGKCWFTWFLRGGDDISDSGSASWESTPPSKVGKSNKSLELSAAMSFGIVSIVR